MNERTGKIELKAVNGVALLLIALLISFSAFGQEVVKGVVFDRKGPMHAVVVTESGTNNKVMTDVKGAFEITMTTSDATLTFNFVGFQTKVVKVKKNKTLKVKMRWEGQKYDEETGRNGGRILMVEDDEIVSCRK